MVLVDSSVLIGFLRGSATPAVRRLEEIEREGEAAGWALPLVCLQEVLQGARDEKEWRTLLEVLGPQEVVSPADPLAVHVEAARIFYECRRRRLTVRSTTDCFIAALALEQGRALLHDDTVFDAIAKVRPLRTLRG